MVNLHDTRWLRGHACRATIGCMGAFYLALGLDARTSKQIEDARESCKLPRLPGVTHSGPAHKLDRAEQNKTFQYHVSLGCIYPQFMEQIAMFEGMADPPVKFMVDKLANLAQRTADWQNSWQIAFDRSAGRMTLTCIPPDTSTSEPLSKKQRTDIAGGGNEAMAEIQKQKNMSQEQQVQGATEPYKVCVHVNTNQQLAHLFGWPA